MGRVLAVLCFSLFLVSIDNTIVNVALPTIQSKLSATNTELQWIAAAYTIVFACLLLFFGALGDRRGRRLALLAGLALFGASSLVAAVASTPGQLIAARAGMGAGGALIMPATLSTITALYPDPRERRRAIAIWAGAGSVGLAVGPLAGGLLLDHFPWGSVFLINLPVVAAALIGTWRLVPETRAENPSARDSLGVLLSIVAICALLYAIIEAPVDASKLLDNRIVLSGLGGLAAAIAFVAWERRRSTGIFDLDLFRNMNFTAANVALVLVTFVLLGSLFLIPQFLQHVQGRTPMQTGIAIMPLALGMVLFARPAATLADRIGSRRTIALGLGMIALGLVLAVQWVETTPGWETAIGLGALGIGMAITMTPAMDSVMGSFRPAQAGVGSAMNDTLIQIGGALGVAIMGSLFALRYQKILVRNLTNLPGPDLEKLSSAELLAMQDSVAKAVQVSAEASGVKAEWIAESARYAFVAGHTVAMWAAVVATVVVLLVVLALLPEPHPGPDED
ncbi:MAG: MFS transporter [Myxococcota bacterium]|nr:MFS transporter [Myxococcota bacterium]MDP7434516.1 MFS transporter [Myxococcota bacterium]